jgi:signal peptidase II
VALARYWPFFVSLSVIIADRASKWIIETRFEAWDIVRVIPGLFQIIHTRNTGIAFGMFAEPGNEKLGNRILIGFSLAVMVLIGCLLWKASHEIAREHWTMRLALAFVLGGAAGNLYDRIAFSSVTDFLDFYWGSHHFPIFNLADSAITAGAILLLANLWLIRHPEKTPPQSAG